MRKVFAILVSLCIGPVCGFIVPSGIPEFIDEDAAILAENDATKLDEMKLSTIEPGYVGIPTGEVITNFNKINLEKLHEIDDNALYENSVDKENNVNERSYVYINQKFKPPVRKGFHRSKQLEKNIPAKKMFIPPVPKKETTNKKSSKFSYGFFQPSLSEMLVKDVSDNYILSKNECEDCAKGKLAHGLKHKKYDKINNKGIDEELNYVELLKPPYVRTLNKNNKIKYEYPNINDFSSGLVLNQNIKKYSNSEIPSSSMQKEISTFRRQHFADKTISNKSQKPQKEDNLIFDDDTDHTYRPIEETPEERPEMDRFQKNTYGEQITNEKVNINYDDCNYKDCMQTKKKFQRRVNMAKCKCRVKVDTNKNNVQQDNFGKGKMKTDKSTGTKNLDDRKPTEESDYDTVFIESAGRSVDDELMKTVNKLNYTLQMYR